MRKLVSVTLYIIVRILALVSGFVSGVGLMVQLFNVLTAATVTVDLWYIISYLGGFIVAVALVYVAVRGIKVDGWSSFCILAMLGINILQVIIPSVFTVQIAPQFAVFAELSNAFRFYGLIVAFASFVLWQFVITHIEVVHEAERI